jgi:hypothetical protein
MALTIHLFHGQVAAKNKSLFSEEAFIYWGYILVVRAGVLASTTRDGDGKTS